MSISSSLGLYVITQIQMLKVELNNKFVQKFSSQFFETNEMNDVK